MLKVLFVVSEAVPFVKTGGLADVAGSLPKELRSHDIDVRVALPKYEDIPSSYKDKMTHLYDGAVSLAWREQYYGVEYLEHGGAPCYFIDNEQYFKRAGLYGFDDDAERFAFFAKAVLSMLKHIDFMPDIIHCHDWHTGLVNVYLKAEYCKDPAYANLHTMFTIHNLKYQGVFPKGIMDEILGLEWEHFNNGGLEFYDQVNYMKGGIAYADLITTVSDTYAQEIQMAYFGEKLDGLLRARSRDLVGIVNGIDYGIYDPAVDEKIFVRYDADSCAAKSENKVGLQDALGLPRKRSVPLLAIVSRLEPAKGLDLVAHIADELVATEDIQLVVLGEGAAKYEDLFRALAWKYPGKVSANIGFDDGLAHRIYAASDLFLMPSRYEPCGIGQLIALHYGSIPVVRETGGLKDTVRPFDKYTGQGNGFVFGNYNAHELLFTIKRALGLFEDKPLWATLVGNAMRADFSWKQSARKYEELYYRLSR